MSIEPAAPAVAVEPLVGPALGMYGETPRITVGEYTICRQDETSIWIERENGEGGQFSDALFEAAVAEFYRKNF